ncbi:MAG TPA: transposase [Anaerovoracaceae bacterium]|nr:transposase [Anaerovoracaceae bacterium]
MDRLNKATSKDRVNVLVIDDSFYDRSRSKKVELLARVFDHSTHKFVKGFKMLTLGWSDGNTFMPAAFSLLSSAKESNVFQPVRDGIDKRTTAYKRRISAVSKSTEVIFQLLDSAKGLPAKYVLFDSWYGLPVTIYGIWKKGYDVICMVKRQF